MSFPFNQLWHAVCSFQLYIQCPKMFVYGPLGCIFLHQETRPSSMGPKEKKTWSRAQADPTVMGASDESTLPCRQHPLV